MTNVSIDTNVLIYFFEDQGPRGARAMQIVSALSARGDNLVISTLVMGEILVKPLKAGDHALADRYRRFAHSPGVQLIPFDENAAEIFAQIRTRREMKAPDAVLLATAARAGCDLYITNDDRLSKAFVPGIKFIVSMDRAPL